jgi:hypothetical protein
MAVAGGFGTGFPNAPFLDADGNIVPVWRDFLVALYKRTGAQAGSNVANAISQAQLNTEIAARIAADTALGAGIAAETAARIAAVAAEAQTRAAMDDFAASTNSALALIAVETSARIAGDKWKAGIVNALGSGLVLSGGVLSAIAAAATQLCAPLVNGDLPGPVLMSNGSGGCIVVPV